MKPCNFPARKIKRKLRAQMGLPVGDDRPKLIEARSVRTKKQRAWFKVVSPKS